MSEFLEDDEEPKQASTRARTFGARLGNPFFKREKERDVTPSAREECQPPNELTLSIPEEFRISDETSSGRNKKCISEDKLKMIIFDESALFHPAIKKIPFATNRPSHH